MRRIDYGMVRADWQDAVSKAGVPYWPTTLDNGSVVSYWREGQFYDFTEAEIEQLDRDARTLFEMCVEAGDHMLAHPEILRRMGIPDWCVPIIKQTWDQDPSRQSVFGRFDVRFGGDSPESVTDRSLRRLKLLEFNADTPTSLPESAMAQWDYHVQTGQGTDQWNQIFEKLTEAWRRNLELIEQHLRKDPVVYFGFDTADHHGEDYFNTLMMQDACMRVRNLDGSQRYQTRTVEMNDIVLDESTGAFFAGPPSGGQHIDVLFKLYPWEWLVHEEFGRAAFADMARPGGTVWIEAPWKMLWSNKGLLPVLWELFGGHPDKGELILPAFFEGDPAMPAFMEDGYVTKPLLSREGANVTIVDNHRVIERNGGDYGEEGYVRQSYAALPNFRGADGRANHPVLGIWMVDGETAGLGIRESEGLITNNTSYFAPHVINYGSVSTNDVIDGAVNHKGI